VAGGVIGSLGAGSTSPESIALSDQDQRLWLQAMIGPDGAFEFPKVLPGLYTVSLNGSWPAPRLLGLQEVQGRGPVLRVASSDVLDLRIVRRAEEPRSTVSIEGRAVAADGGRVPAMAFLQNGLGVSTTTYPDGRLRVSLLPGDQEQISLSQIPDGFVLRSLRYGTVDLLRERVRIVAGSVERLEVVLSPFAPRALRSVRGRIVGQERLGPGSFVLSLSSGGSTQTTTWGADGAFELTRVLPGTYALSARVAGDTWWAGRVVYLGPVVVSASDVAGITPTVPTPLPLIVTGTPDVDVARLEPSVVRTGASGISIGTSERETGVLFVQDGDRVTPGTLPPGYQIEALTFGDIDLLREPIRLAGTSPAAIRATVGRTPPDPNVRMFSVSGRVTGVPGANASALRVRIVFPSGVTLGSPVLADGSFRFDGIPADTYAVELVGADVRARVIVQEGDVSGVVLAAR
jgi:hypothetical protein